MIMARSKACHARSALLPLLAWACLAWLVPECAGLWTDCSLEDVLDLDAMPLMANFWDDFVKNASALHIDTGVSLDNGRFFARWTYILAGSDEMLAAVAQNCFFGVLTMLLQALPAIDYDKGRGEALRFLGVARSLVSSALPPQDVQTIIGIAEEQGWQVQPLLQAFELYDAYLSDPDFASAREDRCSGPRHFVYPPPATLLGGQGHDASMPMPSAKKLLESGPREYASAMLNGPWQCLFGMYGTEYIFHHFFRSSPCAVDDPSEADLFFVPSYFKCIEVLNYVDHFDQDETEGSSLFLQTVQHIEDFGPWFRRHDGSDHVFLFSWGRFPCRLPDWRLKTRSAVLLQVEDQCEDLNFEAPEPTFNRWKDIVIPGHVDRWRTQELQRWNLPFSKRDVLMTFHGRHPGNTESYQNVSIRGRIVEELDGLHGVSVGGFIEDYHELMGQSIFCLAPRGITPWTIHLYVSMMAGCIPVILSDDFEVPFQDTLDWPSFSIKWPSNASLRALYEYLMGMSPASMAEMKANVDANACWFNYYSSGDCSPFQAVSKLLQARVQTRPSYTGRWWGPGNRPLPANILS